MSLADVLNNTQALLEKNPEPLGSSSIVKVFDDIRTFMQSVLERTAPKQTKKDFESLPGFQGNRNIGMFKKIERFKANILLCLKISSGYVF
jgi:hypothetical protein